jgi:hypothetical protein
MNSTLMTGTPFLPDVVVEERNRLREERWQTDGKWLALAVHLIEERDRWKRRAEDAEGRIANCQSITK